MRCLTDLHTYQHRALEFIKEKKKCALWLDMGLGKTVISWTAIAHFIDNFSAGNVLIIAPLRVANTVWKQETQGWEHLLDQDVVICTGNAAGRTAAITSNAAVTVINRENVVWLTENFKWRWNTVIIDESSSFKSFKAKRFKALKKVSKNIDILIELTGTPAPNGQMDLWSQMYLIDQGERLGRTITNFRQRFFTAAGFKGYGYELNPGADLIINELVSNVCMSMSSEDYLDLPDRIDLAETITLDPDTRETYDELEKEFFIDVGEHGIEAVTAGVLAGKLLQICNGAIYDETKKAHDIHDHKINALREIVEDNPGENFLVAYNFKSDLARIQKAFPKAVTLSRSGDELEPWNRGEIKMLLAHPASAGHGLNAQYGGSAIIWFGLNWSLELYQQFNARLHRQGQTKPVRVMHIVAENTIDERVMKAIAGKAKTQKDLLDYIKGKN
jgi:SNF2 family DNA or RNA helicase